MYNVSTKLFAILLTAASVAGLASCGNSKSEEQIKAEALLSDAQSMFDSRQYDKAIAIIDSLSKTYPGMLDVQRNAMHLKTLVTEKKTILDSISNDSIIAANKHLVDSLSKGFKFIKTKDMVEGYYVKSTISANNLTKRTDIEARIDERGNIYLVSSLYGRNVKHTRLKASCDGAEVETENVAFDNAKNYRFKDGSTLVEMVTFDKEACDTLCQFIAANRDKKITLEFNGSRSYKMPLPANTKNAIAETYLYATHKAELKKAEDLKLYYAKKLQITRRQSRQTATNISGTKE